MLREPLFWLYLFCHFLIFIFLTNRIGIRQHARWNEVLWTLMFLVAQALPTLGLLRIWDFKIVSWPALPWFWQAWTLLVGVWVLAMSVDLIAWRLLRFRKPRVRLISARPSGLLDPPPMAWLSRIGVRNQYFDLRAVTWEAFPPGWPRALDGFSVVQVSDLHHNRYAGARYLERLRKTALALKPDLFAFTGDYVSDRRFIPEVMRFLKGWKAPLGCYAILGNHDHWADAEAVRRGLRKAGIRLLENETVLVRRRGAVLAITGVDDIWAGKREDAKLEKPKADAHLLLAHQPDHAYLAQQLGVHLALMGHTHGGQIRFPWIGPLVIPADEGRKLAAGFQRRRNTLFFINSGIGAYPPLRVLCPPEVVKLVLRSGENQSLESPRVSSHPRSRRARL